MNFSFGAHESPYDKRTIQHGDMATMGAIPELKGGYDYAPTDIEHQHSVGICTAISLVQNAQRYIGHRFSPDFQYLLQKKYIDQNWDEGSSIFSALKVGKTYGFLPIEFFTYVTEADRNLPYSEYIARLQSIPDNEIQRLISLASDYKLDGYAQVDISNTQSVTKAITDSKSGILCRFEVGEEWYTAPDGRISWTSQDINPLRPPKVVISGHAIGMPKFDFTTNVDFTLANTWGAQWNREGLGDILWGQYKPTEAWIPYYGLNQAQLDELKSKLQKEIGIIQTLINLWQKLKGIKPA